jgi:2',3'-cyclic-nucleotide 2'-phosphodiesterase (5'-nucleotidase family)
MFDDVAGETPIETRRRAVLAGLAGAGSLGTAAIGSSSAQNAGGTLTLVHDTHFHGRFESASNPELNISRYHTLVDRVRNAHENVAFLGNGDDLGPSLLGLEYEGEQMVDALNEMGPAAVGAGNHEFDFGVDVASKRFEASSFPWVISNLLTPDGEPVPGTERWTTIEAGEHTVGVFGLGTTGFKSITDYPEDWQVLGYEEAASEAVAALEDAGAEFIVLASHVSTGVHETVAQIDGVDAIVGSHSGVVYDTPQTTSGTTIAEFGDEFDHLGRLTFDIESGELVDWERLDLYDPEALEDGESPPTATDHITPVDVRSVEPTESMAEIVDTYTEELEARLSQPIVDSEVELDATFDNYAIETAWGNLLTDLMREVGDDLQVDVGIQNAGGIRSNSVYGPGEITAKDVTNILPFPNTIEVWEVTGEQLRTYLRDSVRPLPGRFGAQPAIQVSGLSYEWTGHDGRSSVSNVFVGGVPLDTAKTYRVATNDFVAGRSVIGEGERILRTGQFQGPYTVERLKQRDGVAPEREYRIIRVDADVGAVSITAEGGEVILSAPVPEKATSIATDTGRVVARTGATVTPKAVTETDGRVVARFDPDSLAPLVALDSPTLRLFGGFDPDDQAYGYTNEETGELADLPLSSGYSAFRYKATVDASALGGVVPASGNSEAEKQDDSTGATDGETGDGSANEVPGFGPAAGAVGLAGGAYLYRSLRGPSDE